MDFMLGHKPLCFVLMHNAFINCGNLPFLHTTLSSAKESGRSYSVFHKMFRFEIISLCLVFMAILHYYKPVRAQSVEVPITPGQECQMTPVIHILKHPGCIPKAIPSFACIGKCTSYVQVSGSKIWQMERTCNCCQESGEREATVILLCPKAKSEDKKLRKITTKAPLECMCRPCGNIDENSIIPQEVAGYTDEGPLYNHFRKSF